MEFESTISILDLLFDDHCGLLKEDTGFDSNSDVLNNNPNFVNLHTEFDVFNFIGEPHSTTGLSNFDLLGEDIFDNLPDAAQTDSSLQQEYNQKTFRLDHDYVAHKSPSQHSDGEVSTVSDESSSALRLSFSSESNLTDDQLEFYATSGGVSDISSHVSNEAADILLGSDTTADLYDRTLFGKANQLPEFDLTDDVLINFDFDSEDSGTSSPVSYNEGTQTIGDLNEADTLVYSIQQDNKGTKLLPFTVKDINPDADYSNFQMLCLSDEEKELLAKEGVTLPDNLPLTREEERALKAVRRKIRNKLSAKESRKKKQGYIDGLEQRVRKCTQENRELHSKVQKLENQNTSLIDQLKQLQTFVKKLKVPANASTFTMVLLLSCALILVPVMNPMGSSSDSHTPIAAMSMTPKGNARSLLEAKSASSDDDPYGTTSSQLPSPWKWPFGAQSPVPNLKETAAQLKRSDIAVDERVDISHLPGGNEFSVSSHDEKGEMIEGQSVAENKTQVEELVVKEMNSHKIVA